MTGMGVGGRSLPWVVVGAGGVRGSGRRCPGLQDSWVGAGRVLWGPRQGAGRRCPGLQGGGGGLGRGWEGREEGGGQTLPWAVVGAGGAAGVG